MGYSHFAAETLHEREELGRRGYPALGKTGYYTNEPLYGDLVRTAMALGFKIVAYEYSNEAGDGSMVSPDYQKKRDRGQAQNLYARVFQNNPDAKLVVQAGYDHIHERDREFWSPMAAYFREVTGIDPLTVEQTEMSERSSSQWEPSMYRWAEAKWRFREPVVLQNRKGETYLSDELIGLVDLMVLSPRTGYVMARPDWMRLAGSRQPIPFRASHVLSSGERLVVVRREMEGTDAVPVDVATLAPATNQALLWLPQGKFVIDVKDAGGETTEISRLEVH